MARHVHRETGESNLCLAGGVALNCVANGRLHREGPFENIWVQPAAGDSGGALGAALMAWHEFEGRPRTPAPTDSMEGSYLGPSYSADEIGQCLASEGIPHELVGDEALPERVAALLAQDRVVGWFQGRMEYGPRALGARSILADARSPEAQRRVNLKIKFRESFRPFAPSVIAERCNEYFDFDAESPYMLMVAQVRDALPSEGEGFERLQRIAGDIPAVTHVDGSARIQTVHEGTNPLYYRLLKAFEAQTGCPVIVNTSFNVRGEPIVCTPREAYTCFRRTHIDALVLGPYLLTKQMFSDADDAVFSAEEVAAAYGLD
jgi:carbamoyltransferase